ncbi:hypothetical protein E2562_028867 [Oryza meyeriana var. granulata]|uniref:Retroviral polymerase SH3-like domain-containing protein n=1 Tax=Oryza meyeriana var. granulata TaxID=110450 RepID=A0A6G1FDI2_9ORYZ|nr:hypothetical protein E2562_028867 [Oryza meyeriana var. granulata]
MAAVFIGYEDSVKAYRLLDPMTRRVCITRDDSFHGGNSEFIIEHIYKTREFVTPRENDDERLDAAHGKSPVRYRTVDNLIRDASPPGLVQRDIDTELPLASMGEPCSFAEVEHDAAWWVAMEEEIDAVERNKSRFPAWPPSHHPQMGVQAREVVKHKVRLVVRDFV